MLTQGGDSALLGVDEVEVSFRVLQAYGEAAFNAAGLCGYVLQFPLGLAALLAVGILCGKLAVAYLLRQACDGLALCRCLLQGCFIHRGGLQGFYLALCVGDRGLDDAQLVLYLRPVVLHPQAVLCVEGSGYAVYFLFGERLLPLGGRLQFVYVQSTGEG